jgi:serine/threonine protein kinase
MVGSAFWRVPEVLQVLKEGATPVMKEEVDAYSFSMLCYEILTDFFTFDSMKDWTTISYFQGRDQSFLLLRLRISGACWRVVGTNETKIQILKDQVCSVS